MKTFFFLVIFVFSIGCEGQRNVKEKTEDAASSSEEVRAHQQLDSNTSKSKKPKQELSVIKQQPKGIELILQKVLDSSAVALPVGYLGLNRPMPLKIDSIQRDCNGFVNLQGLSGGSYYLSDIIKNIAAHEINDRPGYYRYYDLELVNNDSNIQQSTSLLTAELPAKGKVRLYMSYTEMNTPYQEALGLVSYDESGNIIDGLNIGYDISLQFKHRKSEQKKFSNGVVGKYFQIDENYIIYVNYTDTHLVGEATECHFLRLEKWQIKPNGRFVRFYEKDGVVENKEEKGSVLHSMRTGKWVEMKPNGIVEGMTYLEAEYKEGEPSGKWKFYDYGAQVKGKLLYTETYENGALQKRTFMP